MTLHICIDGEETPNKTRLIQELITHLQKHRHNYNVIYIELPQNPKVIDIIANENLMNHEVALLMAFDYSYTYYNNNFDNYDFIIWTNGINANYKHTPHTFIKQINKYSPIMDMNIIIDNNNIKTPKTFKAHNLINILNLFEEHLPRCQWCGKYYRPSQKHRKYCTKECAEYSLEEQYRINNRNYYKRYKNVLTEKQRGALGSKGANLHGTADPNPIAELEKVRKAKKALGLKNNNTI